MKRPGEAKEVSNIADEYLKLSIEDREAAEKLKRFGLYRQAIYFHCQSIEKYIKSELYKKINPDNKFYHDLSNVHSIEKLMELLIDVSSSEAIMREHIKKQVDQVLEGVDYRKLHNNLRYPYYNNWKNKNYMIEYRREDYNEIVGNQFEKLRKIIKELFKAF